MIENITGVVLAGGESKRFGSPKAFAKNHNLPFYQYSLVAIEPFVKSITIVTNPKLKPLFTNEGVKVKIVNDVKQYQGYGPLAGIYTAMDIVDAKWYLITPIDVPFVKEWVFSLLIKCIVPNIEAVVPVVNGRKQPLLSLYHHSMKTKIKEQLDTNQYSMHRLLKKGKIIYVPIEDERPFTNINIPEDYQQMKNRKR